MSALRKPLQAAALVALLPALAPAQRATGPMDYSLHYGELKDGGTFDYATRTWRRARAAASTAEGPPTHAVFNNTCQWFQHPMGSPLPYTGIEPCEDIYDSGRIPSAGADPLITMTNNVRSVRMGYVTTAPSGLVDIEVTFYDSLGSCASFAPPTPPEPTFAGQLVLNTANGVTLPGDPTGGMGTAWIVTFDLGPTEEFCLMSDGDGTPGNGNDIFNWRLRHNNVTAGMVRNGFVRGGEPLTATFGTCTYSTACGNDPTVGPCGTGLGIIDAFWANVDGNDGTSPASNCPNAFFLTGLLGGTGCQQVDGWPGTPHSSHFLEIRSDGDCATFAPELYCTGKTNSAGCVPFVTSSGTASVTATGAFLLRGNDHLSNEAGLLIYSFKKANLGFHGGKLCVKAPFVRTAAKFAKGTSTPCNANAGFLSRNFNANIQSGNDPLLTAGQRVNGQWRQRDPADPLGFGDNLTDGISFLIQP